MICNALQRQGNAMNQEPVCCAVHGVQLGLAERAVHDKLCSLTWYLLHFYMVVVHWKEKKIRFLYEVVRYFGGYRIFLTAFSIDLFEIGL